MRLIEITGLKPNESGELELDFPNLSTSVLRKLQEEFDPQYNPSAKRRKKNSDDDEFKP